MVLPKPNTNSNSTEEKSDFYGRMNITRGNKETQEKEGIKEISIRIKGNIFTALKIL